MRTSGIGDVAVAIALGGSRTLLYDSGGQWIAGAAENDESRVIMTLLKAFFVKTSFGPIPWLFFDAATGCGEATAGGWFILKPGAKHELLAQGVGVAPVPTVFHQKLLDSGPEALKWSDGKLVVNTP